VWQLEIQVFDLSYGDISATNKEFAVQEKLKKKKGTIQ
jgi:hypothetical protein